MMFKRVNSAVRSSIISRRKSFGFLATAVTLSCAAVLMTSGRVSAEEETEWTITLVKHVNKAIDAYNRGDFATSKSEYRTSIGLSPKTAEFYEGLMYTCCHTKEWDQVAFAASELAKLDPARRADVAFFNGMALYQLGRMDEAVPLLKLALQYGGNKPLDEFRPLPKDEAIVNLSHPENHIAAPPPVVATSTAPVTRAPERLNKQEYLGFETACTRSEWIALCTYEGYDKGDIGFNNPPVTHWNRDKILKGPPSNPTIPIWYEFHDAINKTPPKDWKFDPKLMPAKGSRWIIFIDQFYAKNGAYETYQGSYGRQPVNDENLNKLYSILDQYNMRNANVR